MSETVVFFFLLNDLPDFHQILKSTLLETNSGLSGHTILNTCDVSKTNYILKSIEDKLQIHIKPKWKTVEHDDETVDKSTDFTRENIKNESNDFNNSDYSNAHANDVEYLDKTEAYDSTNNTTYNMNFHAFEPNNHYVLNKNYTSLEKNNTENSNNSSIEELYDFVYNKDIYLNKTELPLAKNKIDLNNQLYETKNKTKYQLCKNNHFLIRNDSSSDENTFDSDDLSDNDTVINHDDNIQSDCLLNKNDSSSEKMYDDVTDANSIKDLYEYGTTNSLNKNKTSPVNSDNTTPEHVNDSKNNKKYLIQNNSSFDENKVENNDSSVYNLYDFIHKKELVLKSNDSIKKTTVSNSNNNASLKSLHDYGTTDCLLNQTKSSLETIYDDDIDNIYEYSTESKFLLKENDSSTEINNLDSNFIQQLYDNGTKNGSIIKTDSLIDENSNYNNSSLKLFDFRAEISGNKNNTSLQTNKAYESYTDLLQHLHDNGINNLLNHIESTSTTNKVEDTDASLKHLHDFIHDKQWYLHENDSLTQKNKDDNENSSVFDYEIKKNCILNQNKSHFEEKNEKFPKQILFLVAIFVKLFSNIPAKTCGGVLLAPEWVLTATNCLDQKSLMDISNTTKNPYSVLAGAFNTNLSESLHNVTQIIFNPTTGTDKVVSPSDIALLRISPPAVKVNATAAILEEVELGGDVMVYGWIVNETENPEIYTGVVPTTILNKTECGVKLPGYDSASYCLYSEEGVSLLNQMNTGSPVIAMVNNSIKLIGIGQTTDNNFIILPLQPYIKWIKEVLNSSTTRS